MWWSDPALRELSQRQLEILRRLLRGERVPMIARDLFLSQSTVRNHLSAIYRRLGVHSQAELLARLLPRWRGTANGRVATALLGDPGDLALDWRGREVGDTIALYRRLLAEFIAATNQASAENRSPAKPVSQ